MFTTVKLLLITPGLFNIIVNFSHFSYLQGGNAILKVNISGVNEAIENFQKSGNEPQAVKVHLELDASGILQTSEVNLIMAHEGNGKSTIES